MRKVVGVGAGLFLLLGGQSVASAVDTESVEGAYRLGEIIVSADAESAVENAGTVYRVTANDIKAQGARTLDEAIELLPGVIIREGAEGTPRIDIRGFRTRHVQLFLNGIPVRDSYDGQFDPTRIPASIIAEIKLTSGGGSVLYGPGANGGAIDIITKTGEQGVHGTVGAEISEGESYLARSSIYGADEKVEFFGNVNVLNRDGFQLSGDFDATEDEDGDERENSDREYASVFGNLSYNLTDQTTLGFTVSHAAGENGKPPVTNADKDDIFSKSIKYERIDDIDSSFVQLAFAHETNGPLSLRGWGYYSISEIEENQYDDDDYATQVEKGAFHQESETEIFGASTQARYAIGDAAAATLGLNAENESWNAEGFEIDKKLASQDFLEDEDVQTYSVALEYERELTDRLSMVVGYGHHFNQRDGEEGEDDGDDNDFSYLLGVDFDLNDTTRLRANHARKVRFPSVKQLYDGDSGNSDLDTEITLHYEIGIEQQLPAGATLDVTGFVIDAEDFIEKDSSGENQNYQEVSIVGVETGLTMRPVDDLMLRFGVTWLEATDESTDSSRDEMQYRPEWKFTAESRYAFDFGLTASGSVQHVADQYFYDNDDGDQQKKLNDITVVSLKLSQTIADSGLEVYAGVDNLFDEDYEESYGLPQPGRTFYGGVEYRF
jgi:outer membrane receptor protein involved in Fe transport